MRSAAVSQQQGNGHGESHDGKGDVGGRIAQIAHLLADEDLVNDIIEGIDQEGDDRGDGEPGNELSDFFRIVNLFLSIVLYTKPIFFSFFMEIWYTEIRKITRIFLF